MAKRTSQQLHAAARERERMRDWLRFILVRCRGMGPGLASQALNTDRWPDWPARKRHR